MIGNCQVLGIAQALRLLLPQARVETHLVAFLARRFRDADGLVRALSVHDHVFSHLFPESLLPGGSAVALAGRLPRLRLFPTIVFPAFHPDMVYVGDLGALRLSRLVAAPLGPSHSAIALAGYREGLGVAQTLALYEDATFERLGYYDLWEEGSAVLLRLGREVGFDLARELGAWTRRGCFMHDVNHPKLHVLADIARRLAAEAGLAPLDVAAEDYLPDPLVDEAFWPVHPAVAARYGVRAEPFFRGRPRPGRPPELVDLAGFVARSFALYAGLPREQLVAERVERWRADPQTRALFAQARSA